MIELALVLPLFIMVLVGIITLGIGVFYQAQLTNAAREAARFASIHSASAQEPTVGQLDPLPGKKPLSYLRYDKWEDSWPYMTAAARALIFGLNPADVNVAACWSGYRVNVAGQPTGEIDAPPPGTYLAGTVDSSFAQCTIDGANPATNPNAIGCSDALAPTTVDKASSLSEGQGRIVANTITAYTCYVWKPPMAGFLLIPDTVTLRAVITEPIERQQ